MIMFKYLGTGVCLVSLLFACTGSVDQRKNAIKINLDDSRHSMSLSAIASGVSYLPLEFNDSCVIGNIGDLKYVNDHYFVLDKQTKSVYIFNEKGKYISRLCHTGKGPGEYINPATIAVNRKDTSIDILDPLQRKIITYAFNGKFLRETFVGNTIIRDFIRTADNKLVCYTPDFNIGSKRGLWLNDEQGRFSKDLVNLKDAHKFSVMQTWYFCNTDKDTTAVYIDDRDDIYHVCGDTARLAYSLEFNRKTPAYLLNQSNINVAKHLKEVVLKVSYLETPKWFFLVVVADGGNNLLCYSKTGQSVLLTKEIVNDIDKYPLGNLTRCINNNSLTGIVSPDDFYAGETDINRKNPVLQIISLK